MKEERNQVIIGSAIYEIEFIDSKELSQDNTLYYGMCNHAEFKIKVDNTLPDAMKRATLLHEIIHAMESQYSLKLTETTVNVIAHELQRILPKLKNLL